MTRREEIINNIGYKITRAALDYVEKHEFADATDAFEAGAEWMQKQMIDKACEWLYVYYPTLERAKSFEDAWEHFKKAMEE